MINKQWNKINTTLKTFKILTVLGGISSWILLYQADVLNKYEIILTEYQKNPQKNFIKLSSNLVENYELESAKSLLDFTSNDNPEKNILLKDIEEKEDSIWYKLDSIKKCAKWQSNGSELSENCNIWIMFTPIWDVIDLYIAWTLEDWEEIDKITVWLSVIWIAATAWTIYTWWATIPLKATSWVLKKLHKLDMLPKWVKDKLMNIKSEKDISDETVEVFEKIWELIKSSDIDTAWKLLKSTKNVDWLNDMIKLNKAFWNNTKILTKISWDEFIDTYKKFGDSIDMEIYSKAFKTKGWFKLLNEKWVDWFIKSLKKPKYPATSARILKFSEKALWKIWDLAELIKGLMISLWSSILLYSGASLLQRRIKNTSKKNR